MNSPLVNARGQHWTDCATLTVPEAANVLGIGRSAGYEAVRSGQIPSLRIGRRLLVPVSALRSLLEGNER